MARNNGPLIPDEEIASRPPAADDSALDARFLDLDSEQESPFLRAQKRVPVRRGTLPKKTAGRLKIALIICAVVALVSILGVTLYSYGEHSWRFRVQSSDQIEIRGNQNVSRRQVMEVMGGDIGRNVFFIPLAERQKQLQEIPWVESAAVMRFLPNRLRVEIVERTPVAFVQIGSKIALIDAHGVVMDLPAGAARSYSFPVIVGMAEAEPLSTRAARMKIFTSLVQDLDADGSHNSRDLSEIDLTDPEDVKVTVTDAGGELLVHLGSSDFAARFKIYKSNVEKWRAQYPNLQSVDLRYQGQVIVNPDAVSTAASRTSAPKPNRISTAKH